MQIKKSLQLTGLFLSVFVLSSCGQLISNAKQDFADDLSATLLEQNDPEMVKQAIPAYLVLVSSMVRGDPDNPDLLISASKLYGAYASVFAEGKDSRIKLATTAYDYASHAFCIKKPDACDLKSLSYADFEYKLQQFKKEDAELLFALGSSWAGWLQANSSDWNAVAELPKIKAIIARVLELDETISNGDAHVYMAVMQSFLPPAMGGKPELAKEHFDKAINISKGTNLMAKLMYAEKYARLVFDQKLHDKLLQEVIYTKLEKNELTLINSIAQQKARVLLEESADYF